jgi:hypothetical protein
MFSMTVEVDFWRPQSDLQNWGRPFLSVCDTDFTRVVNSVGEWPSHVLCRRFHRPGLPSTKLPPAPRSWSATLFARYSQDRSASCRSPVEAIPAKTRARSPAMPVKRICTPRCLLSSLALHVAVNLQSTTAMHCRPVLAFHHDRCKPSIRRLYRRAASETLPDAQILRQLMN